MSECLVLLDRSCVKFDVCAFGERFSKIGVDGKHAASGAGIRRPPRVDVRPISTNRNVILSENSFFYHDLIDLDSSADQSMCINIPDRRRSSVARPAQCAGRWRASLLVFSIRAGRARGVAGAAQYFRAPDRRRPALYLATNTREGTKSFGCLASAGVRLDSEPVENRCPRPPRATTEALGLERFRASYVFLLTGRKRLEAMNLEHSQ